MGHICLSHHIEIYAYRIPRDSHYNVNMEYNSIKIIKFMKVWVQTKPNRYKYIKKKGE